MQKILVTLFSVSLLLLAATPVFASLRINEFSSNGSRDWIEIYNDSSEAIDLSLYRIRDSSVTNKLDITGMLSANSFVSFEWGDKLNNGGDIIKLVLITDEFNIIDQVAYGASGSDVGAPASGQSAGRQADSSAWVIFSAHTRGSSNSAAQVAPSPTATPLPTPTLTKTPTPTKTPTSTKSPTAVKTPTSSKSEPTKAVKSAVTASVSTVRSKVNIAKELTPSKRVGRIQAIGGNKVDNEQENDKKQEEVLVKSAEKDYVFIFITSFGSLCLIACAILLFRKGRVDNSNG